MGLTERHWFEDEDVPENYEWALEDAVYNSHVNKKADMDIKEIISQLEKHYEAMRIVSCVLVPDEESKRNAEAIKEASKLLKELPEVIRCKDCKYGEQCIPACEERYCVAYDQRHDGNWYCADGERREMND